MILNRLTAKNQDNKCSLLNCMVNLQACFQWLEINTSGLKNKVNSVLARQFTYNVES